MMNPQKLLPYQKVPTCHESFASISSEASSSRSEIMFKIYDEQSAPEASRPVLAQTKQDFGMIPNLERVMAAAPAVLEGYVHLWALFGTTSLTPIERQVVYQTANFENDCEYCVPWHTKLSKAAGMPATEVEALRQGTRLSDPKLEALRQFTRVLIAERGKIMVADLQAFLGAGYSQEQSLEVILGIAIKVMSNYTNSIAGTPLDQAVMSLEWKKPKLNG
jgi:AhpD family alkylhydroperoxidase